MLGDRLNFIRKERNMTAQQVADAIGVKLRTYRKYESESISPPISNLVKIADLFDISTDFLLCRDDFICSHAEPSAKS